MKAMILTRTGPAVDNPLRMREVPVPMPADGQILVKVLACGVCHTELDEIEGRLSCKLPVIPGHQIVGTVEGGSTGRFAAGERVGIGWINSACGRCGFCQRGNENLCTQFKSTGCDADGGYAQYTVVDESCAYPIPERFEDAQAAVLLCAGAIGYRALRMTGFSDGQRLGLFGFGASAHILLQLVKHRYPKSQVFVFTRSGQKDHQQLAASLGADRVAATAEAGGDKLDCAIDFTPAWKPVVAAMRALERGGILVINAIRKEDTDKNALLELDYCSDLWLEKSLKSVANVTRADIQQFLPLAAEVPIKPTVTTFNLERANDALKMLKAGKMRGAAALTLC